MPDTSVASAYSIPFHGVLYMASRQEGWEAKLEIRGCKRSLLVIYTAVCMLRLWHASSLTICSMSIHPVAREAAVVGKR